MVPAAIFPPVSSNEIGGPSLTLPSVCRNPASHARLLLPGSRKAPAYGLIAMLNSGEFVAATVALTFAFETEAAALAVGTLGADAAVDTLPDGGVACLLATKKKTAAAVAVSPRSRRVRL